MRALRGTCFVLSVLGAWALPAPEFGKGTIPLRKQSQTHVAEVMHRHRIKRLSSIEPRAELRGGNDHGAAPSVFWPIFTCMLYTTSVAITLPAIPSIANKIANSDGSTAVSPEGVSLRGTFSSIDIAFTMFFTKLWGSMSDKHGRIPFMLLSTAGLAIGWVTVLHGSATKNLPMLYAGRAIDGITSCMQPLCQSAIKDVSTPERLQANFGLFQGGALGGSLVIGGVVGGILTKKKGPDFVIAVAAAVAAFNAVVTGFFAPETLHVSRRAESVNWPEANPLGALSALTKDSVVLASATCLLLALTALNGLQVNFFSYLETRFQCDRAKASGMLSVVGIVIALSQLGLGTLAVASVIMAFTPSLPLFAAAVLLFSAGCLCLPLLSSVVASRARSQESGSVMSALDTASMLQRMVAFKGMSLLLAVGMRGGLPGAFFLVCAGCCVSSMLLFHVVAPHTNKPAQ